MYNRSNIAASSISICLLLIVARVRKLHGWLAGASVANYKNAAMRFLYMLEILTAGEREKAWFRLAISLICCDIDKIHKLRKRMYTIRPDNLNLKNGERVSACSILVIKHTFTIYKKIPLGKNENTFSIYFAMVKSRERTINKLMSMKTQNQQFPTIISCPFISVSHMFSLLSAPFLSSCCYDLCVCVWWWDYKFRGGFQVARSNTHHISRSTKS